MPLFRTVYDAYVKFLRDDGWAIASHIALSTLMSLFPFLIFLATLAGFFGARDAADSVARLLFEAWPPEVARPIAREIHNVLTQPHGGLLTLSGLLAIYFSSSGVEALRIGLNRAYDARDERPWWLLRFEAIIFVFVGAASLLVLAFLLVLAPLARTLAEKLAPGFAHELEPLYTPVRYGVTSTVLAIALMSAHVFLPAGRRKLGAMLPGVALTLGGSLAFGVGFGAYLAEFASNYVSTYAGLASLMIAIVYLYILAMIFIFGAELNRTLETRAAPVQG